MKATNAYKLMKRLALNPRLTLVRLFLTFVTLFFSYSTPILFAFTAAAETELDTPSDNKNHEFNLTMGGLVDDSDQAILEALTFAAKEGSAKAALAVGNRFFEGTGVAQNTEAAISWWSKASSLGSPEASYNLGVAYLNGNGIDKDIPKAIAAFSLAAEHDISDAHLALGIMTLHEAKSPADYRQAGEHFERAAHSGSSAAAHNLSLLYEKGLGYEKNAEMAGHWRNFTPDTAASKRTESNLRAATYQQQDRVVHGSEWVTTRPPENYTLQLASGDTREGTKKLISKITTLDCAIFSKTFAEKEWFVAIAGDFLSYAEALSAIEGLPSSFSQNKPFIVNFKILQRQIDDHTKFNN